LFESRPSYPLLGEQLSAGSLHYGLGVYFDKTDVSETLGHELAIACLHGHDGAPDAAEPLRDALGFRALVRADRHALHRRPQTHCMRTP